MLGLASRQAPGRLGDRKRARALARWLLEAQASGHSAALASLLAGPYAGTPAADATRPRIRILYLNT